MRTGCVRVDMSMINRFEVDENTVEVFDAIMRNRGTIHTLDVRKYTDLLDEFGIWYNLSEF